jgi:rubredoxin
MLQKPHSLINPCITTGKLRANTMKTYMCLICGYVYDEAEGDVEAGIPAGTRWDHVPLSWRCPDCGAGKEDFEMVEI